MKGEVMKKILTKIIGASLAIAMMIGVGAGVNAAKQAKEVNAATVTYKLTIDANDFNTTSYAANNNEKTSTAVCTTDNSKTFEVDWTSNQVMKNGDNMQWQKSKGYLYNSTDLGTITSVTVTKTAGTFTTYYGTTEQPSSGSAGDGKGYFKTSVGGATGTTSKVEVIFNIEEGGGGTPITYTSVEVSQKTALTGTYKGDAYYECQATVSGTGAYSSAVTWSITNSNTYGSGTSIVDKATIDANGKITFLDNCTVYVWATAADGTTRNETGFAVAVSTLQDNPISGWTLIDDSANVAVNGIYTLSNDGVSFAGNSVSSSAIAMTSSVASIGYFALESATGGYYLRFATYDNVNDVWEADGRYVGWTGNGANMNSNATASTVWALVEDSTGVYLKTANTRHIGLGNGVAKPYTDTSANAPLYLYDTGNSLPVINCDTIQLTGLNETTFSIGDTATVGYFALGTDGEEWTGDVRYAISNESTSGVVELSATSGLSVTLTAKKAGTARISVQDDAANADPDYVDITVLADPERVDLPVGSYTVTISAADETSSTVPATRDYEIKAKEGSGANRIWYRNLTVAFNGITVLTNYDEYESAKTTGALTVTNNSNATISSVEVHYYKYLNDGVGIYVDDNMLTPTSSTGSSGTDNDLYRGYTNITGNSFALCNKNSSYTNKFFSITITLTVVDENEEFLNLAIIKGATATSFNEGDTPNHNGLTVRENYSTDGETVSRYEDVTASVTWNYSIEKIARRTKSYTVTATYGGHTSAAVTIDGFTVTEITKYSLFESEIVDGDYIILYNGKALQNTISNDKATYSEVSPANNVVWTNATNIVWHIAKDGESNYYTIYNDEAGEYLASTNANNQAKLEDSVTDNSRWTVELTEGKFEFINKARDEASSPNKYLRENTTYGFACYQSATGGSLSLYRLNAEGYLKSASAVATYTEEASGNILRLGSSIPVETWNYITATETIEDYGVMIYKTDSVANITSETPVEDAYRDTEVAPAVARKGNGNPPTADNGNYVFTARLKVSNPNTVFCAASFVVINGQYYFFNEQHITAGQLA